MYLPNFRIARRLARKQLNPDFEYNWVIMTKLFDYAARAQSLCTQTDKFEVTIAHLNATLNLTVTVHSHQLSTLSLSILKFRAGNFNLVLGPYHF